MTQNETGKHYRILVIDDNPAIHEDFRKVLMRPASGGDDLLDMEAALFGAVNQPVSAQEFDIDFASQGKEGLEMLKQAQGTDRPYAVAFVDGRMPPGWDGIETIAQLWKVCPDLQIVFCTAYADYTWQEIQYELGVQDGLLILKKPFDNLEVLQLAHALTRKWELNHEIQTRLNKLAFYDNLTGLPNRALFLDRLNQALIKAKRYEEKVALLFIDLDNFKRINDTLGHSLGDELLKVTAERIVKCLRASDTVARPQEIDIVSRLGGDEFTIILSKLNRDEEAGMIAQRIAEQLDQPVYLGNHQVIVTSSIGIAIFPQDGDTDETLLKNADIAMYYAKRIGPRTFNFYQESMNVSMLKKLTMENHLRQAFERDEFSLNYQPQVDLLTGQVIGMEALLRWHNWEFGSVPPIEFIPVIEENGQIIAIGEWVMRTACRQAKVWLDQGLPLQRICVNVSMRQFMHSNFLGMVDNILTETCLEPRHLEIEITESLMAKDMQGIFAILKALKEMKVKIAIDDFGIGYSCLSLLKELPIDRLKIDRTFINGICSDIRDQSIISAIIVMAESMNLKVTAEGVETTEQADFLRDNDCKEAQGYLFSRPLTKKQAEVFLEGFRSPVRIS